MVKTHFDYIIVGHGLAGLQLALALSNDPFFNSKQIALIDYDQKTSNDKTWSFWEKGNGKWDHIVSQSWTKSVFHTKARTIDLNLKAYVYKCIRAIDFYTEVKSQIEKKDHIHFILDEVKQLSESEIVTVTCTKHTYFANHVFDSRIPTAFSQRKTQHTLLHQHFKGLVIETEKEDFNPAIFTMMDFRLQYKNTTSFIYILPLSTKKALIEYTFFTPFTTKEQVYDDMLHKYIKDLLNIEQYTILETEMGNIPMTTFPFEKYNTNKITKIGTAGGWVKGSTGYSFKHTEQKVSTIIKNIKLNKTPSKRLFNKRFKFYDKIFLKVLHDENDKGPWVFKQFYEKNSTESMFRFLDETSSFKEELGIMYSLFSWAFIKAFFKTL